MPGPVRGLLAALLSSLLLAQAPGKLNIVIVEGEGAINNIRQRVTREPIVQVEDENRKPVAGAVVTFFLPNQGAGGVFASGSNSMTAVTDSQGRAVARGFRPNNVAGKYQIRVTASYQGLTSTATISQANAAASAATGAGAGSGKLIAILAVVGGAAAVGGIVAATRGGSSTPATPASPPPTIFTPGTPVVGGPR